MSSQGYCFVKRHWLAGNVWVSLSPFFQLLDRAEKVGQLSRESDHRATYVTG